MTRSRLDDNILAASPDGLLELAERLARALRTGSSGMAAGSRGAKHQRVAIYLRRLSQLLDRCTSGLTDAAIAEGALHAHLEQCTAVLQSLFTIGDIVPPASPALRGEPLPAAHWRSASDSQAEKLRKIERAARLFATVADMVEVRGASGPQARAVGHRRYG